jgi:phosphoserine phosphatase RsbU/P
VAETHRDEAPRVNTGRWDGEGYDVAGWYLPAEGTGGDFFDFEEPVAGCLAVSLGDVSGHGSGPTQVAAACRTMLRATLVQTLEPARVITEVNRLLCQESLDDRFVTAFFGILRRETHRLEYLSAGQGPILFYSQASGTIEELAIQGFPLGLSPGLLFEPSEAVEFAQGDFLALVTDGFFEWFNNAGECYGMERTKAQLACDCDRPAAEMIRRLHASVLDFADGSAQPDDLTAVMIKRVS